MNDIIKRDMSIKLHGFMNFHSQYLKNLKSPVRRRFELKIWHKYTTRQSLGVPSPLCIVELSWQIHIEWQSKHNYIYVIYKRPKHVVG